jgi:hypothetical protein
MYQKLVANGWPSLSKVMQHEDKPRSPGVS